MEKYVEGEMQLNGGRIPGAALDALRALCRSDDVVPRNVKLGRTRAALGEVEGLLTGSTQPCN
jgi:hypothetical protein